jgi:hypothetical protein
MEANQVPGLMALVASYWPQWTLDDDRAESAAIAWHRMLDEVEYAAAVAAVDSLAADGREFAPVVGVIRRRAIELSNPPIPDLDEAWGDVLARVGARGFREGPGDFDHPAVADAVRSLGWWRLCYDDNPSALMAQFRDAYRPIAARYSARLHLPPSARAITTARRPELQPGISE